MEISQHPFYPLRWNQAYNLLADLLVVAPNGTPFFLEVNTFFRSDHGYSLSDRFTVPHIFSLSDFLSDQIYEKKLSDRFTVPYIFSLSDFLSDQIYGNFLSDRFMVPHIFSKSDQIMEILYPPL